VCDVTPVYDTHFRDLRTRLDALQHPNFFAKMSELNCHFVTFNCGRELVDVDYFASALYSNLKLQAGAPDFIVLSLQELAPLGFSFLGGSFLKLYFETLSTAVLRSLSWRFDSEADWENVFANHLGMTAIMVFARKSIKEQIRWIEEAGTGVGVQEMGNKGAVAVRIGLGDEETVVTFIAAHLAPHEDAWQRRNADWKAICENLMFTPSKSHGPAQQLLGSSKAQEGEEAEPLLQDTTSPPPKKADAAQDLFAIPSYIFVAGDLNYRTSDVAPSLDASSSLPQLGSDHAKLYANDQLTREREAGRTLQHLTEAAIDFPPTYKYTSQAQKLAARHAKSVATQSNSINARSRTIPDQDLIRAEAGDNANLFAQHRLPSWCDRILYLSTAPIETRSYATLAVQPTSDHRPVALICTVPRKALTGHEFPAQSPFTVRADWKERRQTARAFELIVGAGAYLAFTSQGQMILVASAAAIIVGGLALAYALE
jgi:hypothetical protein